MKTSADYILSGLRQRGMPDHIARGFVMNFQDESGLDAGIEEHVANVHGTKGFGLAQWTGPRRDALVQFAAANGKPANDADLQMDFLMQELQGSESGAWAKIQAARTSGEAGAAIVNSFLRPAEEHRASRESRYLRDNDAAIQFDGFTDADGRVNAGLDYEAAYEAPKAVTPPTYLEEESRRPEPYSSWLDEIGASYQSDSFTASAWRWSNEVIDPSFQMGETRAAELAQHVPEHYLDYILSSESEKILQSRLEFMNEDIDRKQRLGEGGWSALGAGLVAGAIDPIPLVTGIATGGIGSAAMKLGTAGRVAAGAAMGAAENAALEVTSQELFDNPNADPVMAAGFGAAFGALGAALMRGDGSMSREAARAFRLAGDANVGKMKVHPDPLIGGETDSINAARNTTSLSPLIPSERAYDTEVHDADAPKGYGGKLRFDVTGQMTASDMPLVRTIGAHLGEEVAGFTDHSVVPDSAASRATALQRRSVGNFISVHKEAEAEFIKEVSGIRSGFWHPIKAAQARDEFNRQVRDWVLDRNPSPDTHPSVVKSGQAFRQGMAQWRDDLERSGLAVLSNDPHYVPMVSNTQRIADIDAMVDEATMQAFFEQAIRRHTESLSPEIVQRMAAGYWRNIRRAGWGMENDIDRAMSTGDRTAFKEALLASLDGNKKLSDEQVDAAFEAVTGALDGTGKDPNAASSRGMKALKKRTLMDYNFKARVKGRDGKEIEIRAADLFAQDAEMLFRNYSRSMSGRVALADTRIENPSKPGYWITEGIKSEADVAKLMEAVKEEARRQGKSPGDKAVLNQLKNLEFMYKRIAGIPVWDQSTASAQWARRIKQVQFIRLMNNMGLNQIQEGWKLMTLTGYRAARDQMPSIRQMVEGVRTGKFQANALNRELQDMTGIGVEGMFSGRAIRAVDERLGEAAVSSAGQKLDGALDWMSEVTSTISLMRNIHDTQSNWAAAAITQQMAGMAKKARTASGFDLNKLSKGDRERLATMGLGAKDARMIFRNILDNATFDGRRVSQINHQKWDAAAVSKYRVFVGRYVDRLVQANDVGGLSKWMSHPVASMLVQFRSFVFGAWGKSTLWALNHRAFTDPRMLTLLAGEMVFGMATLALRMSPTIAQEDGWEKYKEKLLDPKYMLLNGFARTASASVVPMLIDSALMFTPIGPQFGQARSSGTPVDVAFGTPAVDQLDSAKNFVKGSLAAAFTDKQFTQKTANHGLRAFAPFGNWIPIAAGFSALTSSLPEQ